MVMVTVCKLLGACDHYRNTLCGCAKGQTPAYGLAWNIQDKLNQQLEKKFFFRNICQFLMSWPLFKDFYMFYLLGILWYNEISGCV